MGMSWTEYLKKAFFLYRKTDTKNTESRSESEPGSGLESSVGSCSRDVSESGSVSSKESVTSNGQGLYLDTESSSESEPVTGLESYTPASHQSRGRDISAQVLTLKKQVKAKRKKIEKQEGMLFEQNIRIIELDRLNMVKDLTIQGQKWKIEDLEGQVDLLKKHLSKISAIKDALVDELSSLQVGVTK